MCYKAIALTILLFSAASSALGQVNRGTIRGTVLDPSSAAISGARVTAINVDTGSAQSTVSGGAGNYNIPDLPAGMYRVEAEARGFKKFIRQNVRVEIGVVASLDLSLVVGAQTEIVTIIAQAPQLQKDSSDLSTSVKNEIFMDMPLTMGTGRNPTSFAALVTPGAYSGSGADAGPNGGGYAPTAFSGSQIISGDVLVDGLSVTFNPQPGTSDAVAGIAPEALQEAQVTTATASAEYGTGGTVTQQYTIRSGTSHFHGTLYEYFRNTDLDARAFFVKAINKPPEHRNEYGGTLGGPVGLPGLFQSQRTFFFVNVQGFQFRQAPSTSLITIPTKAFKQGDFSGLVNAAGQQIPIYDPATTAPDGAGGFTRTQFRGNVIPQARFSTVIKNILPYLPDPNVPGTDINNFIGVGPSPQSRNAITFKVDHHITNNQTVAFSYTMFTNQVYNGSPFGAFGTNGVLATDYLPTKVRTARLGYDWVVKPNVVAHVALGFNRINVESVWDGSNQDWNKIFGLTGPDVYQGACSVAGINWAGPINYQQIGRGTGYPASDDIRNKWLSNGSVSVVKGRNNFKFGFDFNAEAENFLNPQGCGGYSFSNYETAFPSNALRPVTGDAFASSLLGQVDSAGENDINGVSDTPRWKMYSGYAQDDFKMTRKLTLNLGVRYDLWTPVYDRWNNFSSIDPLLPNPAAGGILGAMVYAGVGPGRVGTSHLASFLGGGQRDFGFTPHVGLAYAPKQNMVVRTGFGINHLPNYVYGTGNQRGTPQGFTTSAGIGSSNQGVTSAFDWDQYGFPPGILPKAPVITPGYGVGQSVDMLWPNATALAYIMDWTFDIQYTPKASWLVDVAYIGNSGHNLTTSVNNPNQLNPQLMYQYGALLQQPFNSPAVTAAGFTAPYPNFVASFPTTPTLAQALRPFPQYAGMDFGPNNGPFIGGSANDGFSTYNALQVKVQKQLTQGLFLMSAFTWSKKMTDADSSWGGGNYGVALGESRDTYNLGLEKQIAPSNIPDRFTGVALYNLPFGLGSKYLNGGGPIVGKILQGWQISGTWQYESGEPIAVFAPDTLPIFNNINTPNSVPGVNACQAHSHGFDPHKMLGMNPAAFSVPPLFTFGTAAQDTNCNGFALLEENLAVLKTAKIREKVALEFRFEVFDAFNRHSFSLPNSNFNTSAFGTVTGTQYGPRNALAAMRLVF